MKIKLGPAPEIKVRYTVSAMKKPRQASKIYGPAGRDKKYRKAKIARPWTEIKCRAVPEIHEKWVAQMRNRQGERRKYMGPKTCEIILDKARDRRGRRQKKYAIILGES